ncbi:MAG: histidine kinase [Bacteroidota bacterium]
MDKGIGLVKGIFVSGKSDGNESKSRKLWTKQRQAILSALQFTIQNLKFRIIHIMPIILALVLPGVRFFSQDGVIPITDNLFIALWLFSSLTLYCLWYFYWQLWDIKQDNKKWIASALLGIIIVLIAIYFKLFGSYADGAVFRLIPPTLLFLTIQYALNSQQKIARLQLDKEQLQTENYKVQLKTLRNQVDPHFLFNSLNTLRSMVHQKHSGSEQFILSLSDFYRQTLQHNEHTTIVLSEELVVLRSYLFLMKSRNEKAVTIKLDVDESLLNYQIPTMALQTVVENCFKHNSMTAKNPLEITITNTDDLCIRVCNNIQPKLQEDKTTGLGLELLKKRYELMNVKNGLTFTQTPEQFCVNLKLT